MSSNLSFSTPATVYASRHGQEFCEIHHKYYPAGGKCPVCSRKGEDGENT